MSRKTGKSTRKSFTSGQSEKATARKADRRVLRTRDALGDALMDLLREKPFESITVQQVLDRAEIGRSTFYAHYRDKDDLFLSDVDEFFEFMATMLLRSREESDRVAPVREMFAHVAESRELLAALAASGKIHQVMELGHAHFARAIETRLAGLPRSRAMDPGTRKAMAQAFAGALLSMLTWWMGHEKRSSPEQMDLIFHKMVWSGAGSSVAQAAVSRRRPPGEVIGMEKPK
jgi:AcrR family transcriptional regulator